MRLLDGKVVLVSGVGPGLGMSTVRAVLEAGGRAVLADAVADRVGRLRSELDASGSSTVAVGCDIRSVDDCRRAVAAAADTFGRLDGIVHVAAVDNSLGGLDGPALDEWPLVQSVNVEGTLQLTREALPLLTAAGGSVVVIGSVAAVRPRRGSLRLAYGMSKAALGAAVRYLAEELGPDAVRVNNVAPGFKYGPVVQSFFESEAARLGTSADEVAATYREELALPDFATDEDVAHTVVFFLSDWSRAITGQTIYVDGGFVMT